MMCRFGYDGGHYEVSDEAYSAQHGFIRLPDGRVLFTEGWLETMPPRPVIGGIMPEHLATLGQIFDAVAI